MLRFLFLPTLLACGSDPEKTELEPTEEPTEEPSTEDSGLTDKDGDGYTVDDGDCDDNDPYISPEAEEIPGDGIDNDCEDGDAEIVLQLEEGDIVVTEIMANPSVIIAQKGQWFELYNNTAENINLAGLTIQNDNGEGFVIPDLPIESNGYVTLGNGGNPSTNGGIVHDYVYRDFVMGFELSLILEGGLIDRVQYGGAIFPYTYGQSISLAPEYENHIDNDNGFHWCAAQESMSSGDYASPQQPNGSCPPLGVDADGDGYPSYDDGGLDCNDTDPNVSPVIIEINANGIDDDCDGEIDEAIDPNDVDNDGYPNLAAGGTDCDDLNIFINPDALETGPNEIDENCDGFLEYGLCTDECTYANDGECDDGAEGAAYDMCDFGSDCSDCAPRPDNDGDGVFYGGTTYVNADLSLIADCDDENPERFPGAIDYNDDGVDQDCSGSDYTLGLCFDDCSYAFDGECDDGGPNATYSVCELGSDCTDCGNRDDLDQDGFYAEDGPIPPTSPMQYPDCDDSDAGIYPGAPEIQNDGIDQDCTGADLTTICTNTCTYAFDGECDDGSSNSITSLCGLGTDCDDCGTYCADCDICDGVDSDNDGAIDEDFGPDPYEPTDSNNVLFMGSLNNQGDSHTVTPYLFEASDEDAFYVYFEDVSGFWPPDNDEMDCTVSAPSTVDLQVAVYWKKEGNSGFSPVTTFTTGVGGSNKYTVDASYGSEDGGDYKFIISSNNGVGSCTDTFSMTCTKVDSD
jgi:hypothetical protein